ncbi:alpha/beta family hydrolase [Mesorhizobium sp. AaZ16]
MLFWPADGDHDFKPRKGAGATAGGNLDAAVERVAEFSGTN